MQALFRCREWRSADVEFRYIRTDLGTFSTTLGCERPPSVWFCAHTFSVRARSKDPDERIQADLALKNFGSDALSIYLAIGRSSMEVWASFRQRLLHFRSQRFYSVQALLGDRVFSTLVSFYACNIYGQNQRVHAAFSSNQVRKTCNSWCPFARRCFIVDVCSWCVRVAWPKRGVSRHASSIPAEILAAHHGFLPEKIRCCKGCFRGEGTLTPLVGVF